MSYLDDPDHEFVLDPSAVGDTYEDLERDIKHIADNNTPGAGIEVILQGFLRLQEELPEATTAQCFGTSMVWYFG